MFGWLSLVLQVFMSVNLAIAGHALFHGDSIVFAHGHGWVYAVMLLVVAWKLRMSLRLFANGDEAGLAFRLPNCPEANLGLSYQRWLESKRNWLWSQNLLVRVLIASCMLAPAFLVVGLPFGVMLSHHPSTEALLYVFWASSPTAMFLFEMIHIDQLRRVGRIPLF